MARLTGEQLKDSYQNLLTIDATIESDPLTGQLENGLGNPITALGIGTDSPNANLHLSGTTDIGMRIKAGASALSYIDFDDADSGTPSGSIAYNHINDSMTFATGGSNTERMRIDSGGDISFRDGATNQAFYWDASTARLGIGTDSPVSKLDILQSGDTFESGFSITRVGANRGNIYLNSSNDTLNISRGGTEAIAIDSSGNVGIGTTSVSGTYGKLTVAGGMQILDDNNAKFEIGRYSAAAANSYIKMGANSNSLRFTDNNDQFDLVTIDSSGNVGIGETNPLHKMEIKSTSDSSDISLKRSQNVLAGGEVLGSIFFSSDDGNLNGSTFPYEIAKIDATSHAGSSGSVGTDLRFFTNLDASTTMTERMRIDNEGNVGIGVSPASELHVKGEGEILRIESTDATGDCYISFNDSSANKGYVGYGSSTNNDFSIENRESGSDIFFQVGTTKAMRIDSSGTVIINTNTTSGVQATNFKAFGYSSNSFVEVRNNTSNSADLRIVRSDSAEVFLLNGHTGDLTIAGALSKGSGSFKIDHPLESKKDTHYLVHSFVESPQANNIYRGSVDLVDGQATVNLDEVSGMTDGTFVLLNTDIHVYTSNESDWDAVKGSVSDNVLTIECQNSSSTAKVNWLVIGERHDQHMIETDWTDENGKVIVEPLKPIENELEN